MAMFQKQTVRVTKTGVAFAILSCVAAILALVFMLPQWNFAENYINLGPKRYMAVMLAVAAATCGGIAGLLMSLQGAADLEGQWRQIGWVGFFCGIAGGLAGIILGLCAHFYRM